MLDQILGAGTSATKLFFEVNKVSIDNPTFKLFYKATTSILLAFAFLSSFKQLFGDPITCEAPGGGVNDGTLQAYCWMYSQFSFPGDFKAKCVKREHDGSTLYNSYYQWVAIFLVASALLFYIPRSLWLLFEGGLMKFLAKGATGKIVEDSDKKRESLLYTFKVHLNNKYDRYAAWFFMCEQLNFAVVILQWFLTNGFLKYQFIRYGPAVIQYYEMTFAEQRYTDIPNPMCELFPRIAACNYVRYGSAGGQEFKQAICVLGMNMINDKIFLALWFWYFFLTAFSLTRLLYRIIQLTSGRFRWYVMKARISRYFKSNKSTRYVERYVKCCSYGNWFVLYQMSRNMNRRFFAEFLTLLSVQNVQEDELGSDECLIGDALVKIKDMANGGIFIARPDVQQLAVDGLLTVSRRGSVMIDGPTLYDETREGFILNDKKMDILGGAPEVEKDEEEEDNDNSEKKSKENDEEKNKENNKEEENIEEEEEEDPGEKILKEEMARKRKRGVHLDEDKSEEEEVEEHHEKCVEHGRQQKVNEKKLSATSKQPSNQNMRCRKK